MNVNPYISVLMPVYNSERYVRTAVESVLNQTFTNFELLTVDDGSSDNSLSILRELKARDNRIHVISRENRGLVASRNELIGLSRGRYLAVMDSDDICRRHRFERQVAYLDSHPECVALGSRSLIIDSAGMPIIETANELTHEELDAAHISDRAESRMCNSSVILRKDAVLRVKMYCEKYRFSQDLDLFLRLSEIGRIANLPEVLVEYRQHLQSISYAHYGKQRLDAQRAVLAARKRRGLTVGVASLERSMDPESLAEVHRKWAWWALSAGNVATARKHAFLAVSNRPFSLANLRALACSLRGR